MPQVQFRATPTIILALFTAPPVLIGPPGVGKAIRVLDYAYDLKFNTTAYTVTDTVQLNYDGLGATTPIDAFASQSILTATQSQFSSAVMSAKIGTTYGAYNLNRTSVENKAIKLIGSTSNPTLGDGTLFITINYEVYTFNA